MKYKLGELVTAISGYAFKRKQFSENGDIPVIKIKNIESPKIVVDSNTNRISKSLFEKLIRYHVKQNDILISLTGSHIEQIGSMVGKVGMYDQKEPAILNQRVAKLCVKSTNKLDPTYFYYWILRKEVQRLLASQAAGTANQANISVNDIYELEIELPSLENQIIISNRIKKLDRKIQLNNQINDNLVKFAEVLFSEEFNSNEEILLSNYLLPKRGRNLLKKNVIPGKFPVVAGGLKPTAFHNTYNTKTPVVTISASGANAGYVQIWGQPVWSSDSSYIDTTITKNVYFWYLLLKKYQKQIFDAQTGSAQPHIYPKHIGNLLIPNISENSIKKFNGGL